MNSEISTSTINKLGHEIPEIRLRALQAIETQFRVYDYLNYNGPFLMKSLIKWFNFEPICEEDRVLNLIYLILTGHQREDTIFTLGLVKLKDKFKIMEQLLTNDKHKDVIKKIFLTLSSHEQEEEHSQTDITSEEVSSIAMSDNNVNDISTKYDDASEHLDYVVPWETPGPSDLNSLKLLKSSLRLDADVQDIMHAIKFLKVAIVDFPAEYFLQPPYIFQSLKTLLNEQHKELSIELLDVFSSMTKALHKRVRMRQLSRTYCWEERSPSQQLKKTQISVGRYFYELFKVTLSYFKEIVDNNDSGTALQQEFNCCFTVMMSLIDLISDSNGEYHFNEILADLGYLTKYFRKTWDKAQMDQSNRNLYINTLYIMSKTVLLKHQKSTGEEISNNEIKSQFGSISDIRDQNSRSDFSRRNSDSPGKVAVWNHELETALFDFPLKQSYSQVYAALLKAIQISNNLDSVTHQLLNCDLILKPAVHLLQEPNTKSKDEFIASSLLAIQTLSLHKSLDLVQKIFFCVLESAPFFDGNTYLKSKCEEILLRLIAHDDIQVKKTIYRLCCKNVKSFFSSLMDGSTILAKTYSSNSSKTRFLGIPLTTEILTEFICFGLDHIDATIRSHAETILNLILKSKNMMNAFWTNIFEILAPTLPLLLCYASKSTSLGHTVLSMLNPESDLPTQYLIQGNIILLFNNDYHIRQDAVAALMYLLLDQDDAHLFLPNIQNITDVIPNNICVLDNIVNPKKKIIRGIYEKNSMQALIDLLETPNVEPTERKTTFIQLNVLTQDPELNEIFHNANGLVLCLEALQNALKESHSTDHHDSVIPVIGIIAKLFLQIPQYRRELFDEINIYYLLLRALVIFHQHAALKADCAVALLALTFGEYAVGSYNISLPNVCSKLKLPFSCDFHWQYSQFNKKSFLENLLSDPIRVQQNDSTADDLDTYRSHMSTKLKTMWQYVRLQFANLWFDGIEHISVDFPFNTNKDLSVVYSSDDNYPNALNFDKKLSLTKADLKLIQASTLSQALKYWLHTISNATKHSDVITALSAISNNLFSPGTCEELNVATISSHIKPFYLSPPNNDMDEMIFSELLKFLENLIRNEYDEFLHWLLEDFQKQNNIFITILSSSTCSAKCYAANNRFISTVFENAIYSENETIRSCLTAELPKGRTGESDKFHILDKVFRIVVQLLDGTFEKGDLDKLRLSLSLLRIITSSQQISVDEEHAGHLANKLLHFISSIKCLAQTGSNFNKNCLLTIGNLMCPLDHHVIIQTKYIKFLSGLCGHGDVELRAFSWMILLLISRKLKGAEQLIDDLSYLPGGFHACCLSTLLDVKESSTVRELAGVLFRHLIKFRDTNRNLPISVAPRCTERPNKPDEKPFDLIIDIIKYQRLFERTAEALKSFFVHEFIDEQDVGAIITTCDIVRVFCGIFTNLIYLNEGLVEVFFDCGLVFDIIRLIPQMQLSANESAILMLNEICTFMSHCFDKDVEILNQLGVQEHAVVVAMIHCLQSSIYANYSEDLKITTFNSIISIITFVANTSIGYNLIWNLFIRNEVQPLFKTLTFGLQYKRSNALTISVLNLLSSLLTTSGKSDSDHFASLFDSMEVGRDATTGNHKLIGKRKTQINYASELIFSFLMELFHSSQNNKKIRANVCKAIGLLLFESVEARKMAFDIDFLSDILDELESVISKVGMTCFDFVRKYGDQKKDPIICQMKWFYNIIMHWYSKDCLKDDNVIARMCQVVVTTWPWTGTNSNFQLLVIKALAFLSEDSVPVCKAMATCNLRNSQTVLQILAEHAISETSKPKQPTSNLESLQLTLRAISNCSSCVEGRITITKLNILDTINRLHPTITKQYKPWNSVLLMWLELYEIYTRYPDVSTIKHLQLLCLLAKKGTLKLKMMSLTIIRNMAFGASNRPALLASDVLLHTLSNQLETGSADIQILVSTCIWKLLANNYRAKHTIRNTAIPQKVNIVRNSLNQTDGNSELYYILEVLQDILSK